MITTHSSRNFEDSIKISSILFMLLFSTLSFSQINNNGLPTVLPPGPTAFEFLKYGEVPVGKYTGVPNIVIPIYTIEAKGLDIPISLSYHSNGFRVNEEAGWTGLGWTLNAGGSIVQVVNGFDDFGFYRSRTFPDIQGIAEHASDGNAPGGILSNCTGTIIEIDEVKFGLPSLGDGDGGCHNGTQYNFPNELFNGEKDFEPDIFSFNVLGYSGKFVLNWETETFICLTDNKIKITADDYTLNSPSSNPAYEFTVQVPDGHRFIFELKEESQFLVHANTPGSITNVDLVFYNEKASRVYKLKRIYTNQNDIVDFNYSITNPIKNYPSINKSYVTHEALQGWSFPPAFNVPKETMSYTLTEQPISYISNITFANGKIVFSSSDRTDLQGSKKLDKIEIKKEVSTGVYGLLNEFDFSYSYFIGHTNGTQILDHIWSNDPYFQNKTSQEFTHRLQLNSITESGKPPYTFEYNSELLPKKTSLATDYWGHYNGYLNNQTLYPNIYRFNKEVGNSDYYNHANNNKSSSLQHSKAAVLKKIIYPTGGYSTFEYELNKFHNYFVPNMDQIGNGNGTNPDGSFGAGLRLLKTENFDFDNTKTSNKLYTYIGGKLMSPIVSFNEAFLAAYDWTLIQSPEPVVNAGRGYRKTLTSSNYLAMSVSASGKFVGYDQVTEHIKSIENESNNAGKITDKYINIPDVVPFAYESSQGPNGLFRELHFPSEKSTPDNGLVLEQNIYDKDENHLEKIEHNYSHFKGILCINGVKMGSVMERRLCDPNALFYNSKHALGVYSYKGGYSFKDQTINTKYFQNDSIKTTKNFIYNSYNQLMTSTFNDSSGDNIETIFSYPINSYPEFPEAIYMLNQGLYSPVLKKEIKVNDSIVSVEKNRYLEINTTNNKIYMPSSFANGKSLIDVDIKINYNEYDDLGNILEISRPDGITVSYLWGYKGRYPVAKIENASHSAVIGTGVNLNLINNVGTSDGNMRAELNNIRNHSTMVNAMVTTFTYDPLIGVTSMTDPMGQTVYYHYDDFNRLEYVTDKDGKIISKNEYHYKN